MGGVWEILVAPRSAFAALRERPRWRWTFLAAAALGTLGALLQIPAREHVARLLLASDAGTSSALAAMSDARRRQAEEFALGAVHWAWLAYPLLLAFALGLATLVMLLATTLSGGRGGAARLFALAANVSIVNFGIGYLALGAIMLLRGANDFTSDRDLLTALPSLAWLAPQASPAVATALAHVNPFALWSCALLVLGLTQVADAPLAAALSAAVFVAFGGVALAPLAR
jgi:hypothetical protein